VDRHRARLDEIEENGQNGDHESIHGQSLHQ
jgi:hypothetical protein